jgi:nucleoside-diphosphate-sugar epimerase
MESTMADIHKAKDLLNWEPKVGIKEGIIRMLKNIDDFQYSEY